VSIEVTGDNGMSRAFVNVMVFTALGTLSALLGGQEKPAKPVNPVTLELTMEVATTTEDGLPEALRFTLTNAGNVAVDLPMPAIDCLGENGAIRVPSLARLDGPGTIGGHGSGSGGTGGPTFLERVKSSWLHLRPGEYLTFSGDRRSLVDRASGPATYEYWAEYEPPFLTSEERKELTEGGYAVPTEKVESAHESFAER
jgi:hypothetical protein